MPAVPVIGVVCDVFWDMWAYTLRHVHFASPAAFFSVQQAGCRCLKLTMFVSVQWWVYLSLQVLVTACPCALVLSTPVTVVAGLGAAAQQGIFLKGGQFLEALALAQVVTFDKTGTLTQARFKVR
jgi:P-type E1-E2 ATPase